MLYSHLSDLTVSSEIDVSVLKWLFQYIKLWYWSQLIHGEHSDQYMQNMLTVFVLFDFWWFAEIRALEVRKIELLRERAESEIQKSSDLAKAASKGSVPPKPEKQKKRDWVVRHLNS